MADFVFVDGDIRLIRQGGEGEADYRLRQAEHLTRTALRAREIMLMRGLERRERARACLRQAEAACADLEPSRRLFMEARLRRLTAALDWSRG